MFDVWESGSGWVSVFSFGLFNGISTFCELFNAKIEFIFKCLIVIIIIYIFNILLKFLFKLHFICL